MKTPFNHLALAAIGSLALASTSSAAVLFDADFESIGASTTISLVTDPGAINTYTAVGSWTINTVGDSKLQSNAAPNTRLAVDQGTYDFTASLSSNAVLADGVTFTWEAVAFRNGAAKTNIVELRGNNGGLLAAIRVVPTDNVTHTAQYFDGTTWVDLGAPLLLNVGGTGVPNNATLNDFSITMNASTWSFSATSANGTASVNSLSLLSADSQLASFNLIGGNSTAGSWYDNFLIEGTAVPEPSSAVLLLSGVVGLVALRRRRNARLA